MKGVGNFFEKKYYCTGKEGEATKAAQGAK